ncbi:MAG: T9SS type A sorting domain-containing protein [Flavobacteriales bacterium]|nr:T9SS type A sorting domain-containing protein [Flavobacteriales bacterium]
MRTKLLLIVFISSSISLSSQSFTQMTSLLSGTTSSGEPCILDMNGDNLDDVVRYSSGNLIIDYQQVDGSFEEQVYPAGINNYPSWSVAGGDLDGNGFNDLILGSGSEVSFVYANADGTGYNEVNVDDYIFTQRTNMVDIDNDGNLDAFACHDVDQSHPFKNDGTGVMSEDQSLIETVPVGGNYASVWCDFDNDGDVDMYMSKCRGGAAPTDPQRINGLYRNNGDGTFTEMAADVNMADNDQSWVTIFEDFDNDGDFDTYTVNHAYGNRLMENDGTGYFTEVTAGSGIDASDLDSWACIGADFNNDGYVDILTESFANKQFYLNLGGMEFQDMSLPFDDGALGDLNNDGFIDVWTGNTLWMNDGNDNNWIKFSLEGIISNSNGIGARIEIFGDWGMQTRECRSGQSFAPMSSLDVHFGLGSSTEIDSAVVTWPSGVMTVLTGVDINQTIVVPEAECIFEAEEVETSGSTTICAGDEVTLTAPDGYEYLWNTGATSQSITVAEAGNYSVNMSAEDDCLAISDMILVTVIEDETPSLTIEGDEVFCQGGEVTITSTEATSYQWSNNETTQSITVTETGTYSVTIEGLCGEAISEEIEVEVLATELPQVEDLEVSGPGVQTLNAIGENITWYSDANGTDLIGTGNQIEIDIPAEGTTVYVSNTSIYEGISEVGGKEDNSGGGGLPSTGAYSYFDVWEEFTLDQVTVYVVNNMTGNRTFQLVDGNGDVLESGVFNLANGENQVNLDWEVPVGEGFSLRCLENNLFRNNQGVQYPYAIGSLGEIYDSFYGSSYYYYFYNWQITKGEFTCESDLLPLEVSIATSLAEFVAIDDFQIYPNPMVETLNLILTIVDDTDITIRLLDLRGAILAEDVRTNLTPRELKLKFDIRDLPVGTYELQLISDEGQVSRSIVKQ